MKHISLMFVAVLSLAAVGCKKGGADCDKAITNSMALSKADMAKMPGVDDKMMGKMKDLGLQHCKDDKWSDETVKCMSDAKTQAEAQACYEKMSPDQKDKMTKGLMEIMTPPGGAGSGSGAAMGSAADGSAAGAGSAAGSDTGAAGSAAAGSAAGSASDTTGSAGSAAAPK